MTSEAEEILEATADAFGLRLASKKLLRETVLGEGLVRAYEVHLVDSEGHSRTEVLYLETAPRTRDHSDVLVFRNEETDDEVSVWVYPRDPELPHLPSAVFPNAAAVILQKMGFDARGLILELVAYRPGKRAVVRMKTDADVIFMKVVRPRKVEELVRLYDLWRKGGLPVPATLGWTQEGLIGFSALPGVPAIDVVDDLGDSFLDALDSLVEEYGTISSQGDARVSLASRVDWYERRVTAQHPHLAERAHTLARGIGSMLDRAEKPDPVNVHGDLHLGQVFVDPHDTGTITGILDIDTAGLGDPADDAAALYAHLVVTAMFRASQGAPSTAHERLSERVRHRWARRAYLGDPDFVRRAHAIAATHLLAHTLGGLVAPEALIGCAEEVLADVPGKP